MIAVVVAVVVIVVVLAASGVFTPSTPGTGNGGGTGPKVQSHSVNVVNTQNQQFGPGITGAGVYSFTIPSNATAAWLNGSFQVTVCTSIGNYCLAKTMILTPGAWANYQSGATVSVVWCVTVSSNSCEAEQNTAIASGNLVGDAGQTLDLVCVSNATTLSQQYSADATLTYLTVS